MPLSSGDKLAPYEIFESVGKIGIAALLMLCATAPIFGQDTSSDQLLALAKSVPQLPVERIDVKVEPSDDL
jgi:hypothetical protein